MLRHLPARLAATVLPGHRGLVCVESQPTSNSGDRLGR